MSCDVQYIPCSLHQTPRPLILSSINFVKLLFESCGYSRAVLFNYSSSPPEVENVDRPLCRYRRGVGGKQSSFRRMLVLRVHVHVWFKPNSLLAFCLVLLIIVSDSGIYFVKLIWKCCDNLRVVSDWVNTVYTVHVSTCTLYIHVHVVKFYLLGIVDSELYRWWIVLQWIVLQWVVGSELLVVKFWYTQYCMYTCTCT